MGQMNRRSEEIKCTGIIANIVSEASHLREVEGVQEGMFRINSWDGERLHNIFGWGSSRCGINGLFNDISQNSVVFTEYRGCEGCIVDCACCSRQVGV